MTTSFQEVVESTRGDETSTDEEDLAVLQSPGEEEGGTFDDGGIGGFGRRGRGRGGGGGRVGHDGGRDASCW